MHPIHDGTELPDRNRSYIAELPKDVLIQLSAAMRANDKVGLQAALTAVIAAWSANGILQRTTEWIAARLSVIGGSAIGSIIGNDSFTPFAKLVTDKIIPPQYIPSIACLWGTLFEGTITKYVEIDRNIVVVGDNIFVARPGCSFAYSPDGLAVMSDDELRHNSYAMEPVGFLEGPQVEYVPTAQQRIVLLEFKVPLSRSLNGHVPDKYISQVQAGLDALGVPTAGLYVEARIRPCAMADLGLNARANAMIGGNGRKVPTQGKLPLAYGTIWFCYDSEVAAAAIARLKRPQSIADATELHAAITTRYNALIGRTAALPAEGTGVCADAGSLSEPALLELLAAWDSGLLTVRRSDLAWRDAPWSYAAQFVEKCGDVIGGGGRCVIAVLPFKVFRVDYHVIEHSAGYLEPHMQKIDSVIELVRQCGELPPEHVPYCINQYLENVDGGFVG